MARIQRAKHWRRESCTENHRDLQRGSLQHQLNTTHPHEGRSPVWGNNDPEGSEVTVPGTHTGPAKVPVATSQ